MKLLKKLSETSGVSGREERIRGIMRKELSPLNVSLHQDPMGNLIAVRKANIKSKKGQRIMLCSHMDEIGFYIRSIDEKTGFAYVNAAGGFDYRHLFSRRIICYGKKDLTGILNPGGRPTHIATEEDRKKIPTQTDLVIDFGLPAAAVKKYIEIGSPVTLQQDFREMGDMVTGKALDNRVACWIVIRVLQKLKKSPHELITVATVQEEVGLRGALGAVVDLNPDAGVGIDTTLACDTPGVSEHEAITRLGAGIGLKVMDGSLIAHQGMLNQMRTIAKKSKIPYQLEILPRGGTDGGALQRTAGAKPAITISVPTRYIHTTCETVHPKDLDAAVQLLVKWLGQEKLW